MSAAHTPTSCKTCGGTGTITDTTGCEWGCYTCREASEVTFSYSRQDVEALCAIAVAAANKGLRNSNYELVAALEFAKVEASVARGLLWTKADVFEAAGNTRSAADCRRSAEKLDEVIRRADTEFAALKAAKGEA